MNDAYPKFHIKYVVVKLDSKRPKTIMGLKEATEVANKLALSNPHQLVGIFTLTNVRSSQGVEDYDVK